MYMTKDIKVAELFAGVGGFRIGLERASKDFVTVWSNQWEPSTKSQDASVIYCNRFGFEGHSNVDINLVPTSDIPDHDLLVGGFPCQDYSVAATLSRSGGIEGKKGVLWWQIYRILDEKENKPDYLFLENVDRLLKSPASQRGRDFAIILSSLSDLGYTVEWRVVNAADYGMPQRRRRTYITAYRSGSAIAKRIDDIENWVLSDGVMANALPFEGKSFANKFVINGSVQEVSASFNSGKKDSPFLDAGIIKNREVYTIKASPIYDGHRTTLGEILVPDSEVPESFFISEADLPKWRYEKGAKQIHRVSKKGFEYIFSEGGMSFPDSLDKPSRTMITGEGGPGPSRFKHVVLTPSGLYRRLVPVELERLNMFPDNHTKEASDLRRAFLMGNALVCGMVERIGKSMHDFACGEAPEKKEKSLKKSKEVETRIDFNAVLEEYPNEIVNHTKEAKAVDLDLSKNVLIGYVKDDNIEMFLDNSAKIYYTGKRFPSSVALNKLFYFMPYEKRKGIKDLYLIKIARVGTKKEVYPECDDNDFRLVFEVEFVKELFEKHKMVELKIWRAFTDTTLGELVQSPINI